MGLIEETRCPKREHLWSLGLDEKIDVSAETVYPSSLAAIAAKRVRGALDDEGTALLEIPAECDYLSHVGYDRALKERVCFVVFFFIEKDDVEVGPGTLEGMMPRNPDGSSGEENNQM